MRTQAQAQCPICAQSGRLLYPGLQDLVYGAPGAWDMQRCGNRSCQALFLSTPPHPDDLGLAYAGYYTHTADAEASPGARGQLRETLARRRFGYPSQGGLKRRVLDLLRILLPARFEYDYYKLFYLPWVPGGRFLEIGCGAGNQLIALERAGWQVSGFEMDPEAAATASARGLNVQVGDVRAAHLPAASFDAIGMAHVIEHVYDPVGLLTECRRLLKPGGRISVTTPNADSLGQRRFGRAWRGLEPPRHLAVFTPRALRLAFARAGFELEAAIYPGRDAANLLGTSARIAAQERLPTPGRVVPVNTARRRYRWIEALERAAGRLGLALSEEQVLIGRCKPS